MKLKSKIDLFIAISILFIAAYLLTVFSSIEYNPNHIPKSRHDYGINEFIIFFSYVIGWILFVVGLFQIKFFLLGKDRLMLITTIFCFIAGHTLFLLFEGGDIAIFDSGKFRKGMAIFIPSVVCLLLSYSKPFKALHLQSKQQYLDFLMGK